MNSTKGITKAAAVAAAVVAAGSAYAIGSQSGGGDASAAKPSSASSTSTARPIAARAGHTGHGAELADALGVSQTALDKALREIRDELKPQGHVDLAELLAKELGVSAAKVESALGDAKAGGRHPSLRVLARRLGVSVAKVRAGLRAAEAAKHDAARQERAAELAKVLDVDAARVVDALEKLESSAARGRGHARGDHGDFAAGLAEALGLTEEKVAAGLDELEQQHEDEKQKRDAEFATRLADKLGLSQDKVTQALADAGMGHGPGGHRGGRRHP